MPDLLPNSPPALTAAQRAAMQQVEAWLKGQGRFQVVRREGLLEGVPLLISACNPEAPRASNPPNESRA